MKAVVFHGVGDIRLDEVPEPTLRDPFDAIVRLTASAICGTDLHMILQMGNCNHRRYVPMLIELVASGVFDPEQILTRREPLVDAIEAFRSFDRREAGWLKVELLPQEGKRPEPAPKRRAAARKEG